MKNVTEIASSDPAIRAYVAEQRFQAVAKSLHVTTNDDDVRRQLRERRAQVEVTGESREERRGRLLKLLVVEVIERGNADPVEEAADPPKDVQLEESYEPSSDASEALLSARQNIYKAAGEVAARPLATPDQAAQWRLYGSQSGFDRPLVDVQFHSAKYLLTADASGALICLDLDNDMERSANISVGTRPTEIASHEPSGLVAVSDVLGSMSVFRLNTQFELQRKVQGEGRVSSVDIHVAGPYLVSGGTAQHWNLWDVEHGTNLLSQYGHVGGIHRVRLSANGALLGTAGEDSSVRVWDLRSGVPAAKLAQHVREAYNLAWNVDPGRGYELVSAGGDNRCLFWDLRNPAQPTETLYAHTGAISGLALEGNVLLTSSFDETVKVWARTERFRPQHRFSAGSRLAAVSLAPGGKRFACGRFDRQVDMYQ